MDINEELQLKASILDKATDAIMLRGTDNIIFYANEAAYKIYGYQKDELLGMNLRSLIVPQELPYYEQRLHEVLEKGEITIEGVHLRRDKSMITVEIHSHLINVGGKEHILSVVRDITKRKEAEEKIKQSELQFQKLFDAMNEGVALIGTDQHIIKSNLAEAKILGMGAPAKAGRCYRYPQFKHIYPDGKRISPKETAVSQAIKRKCTIRDMEVGFVRPDGNVTWVNINAVPIIDENGKVTSVVRTMTDITEQKQLKDEKEKFTRKLIEVQEEERKRISRDLHDETAQYLALLTLEMDNLILKEEKLSPEVISNLKKLKDAAGKALQEVRRYSHELRPSVLEHFGLAEALELIINEFNEREDTKVDFKVSGEEIRLKEEVELVLFRITQEGLSNIRKHSEATNAKVSLRYLPNKVRLTITDNGKGFEAAKKSRPGAQSNLGLVGMKERANLIAATLRISSGLGKGTTISVDVPISPQTDNSSPK